MRIGVTGATGRMGREVREEAAERGVEVAFATTRDPGSDLDPDSEFASLVEAENPDAVVDFTVPEASVEYVTACAAAGVPIVVGTTGFDDDQLDALRDAGSDAPVLIGANFSRGIQALLDVVEQAVGSLPEYDVEVTETHHNGKRDAPSGTANVLLDRIEDERGESERVHGRVGDQPREDGEIGVHARRAGDVTGEHEALLAGNGEVLELTHRAGDRSVFAAGALDAAAWLADQPADFYRFEEVASEL
ncbi:4-hydroxy-tetrahydrodipicolinate reductase [Halobacterium sp. KA-4]|jgi:4-hydroxy-tetrahydrodipicolinate reductase|uniref:4-hydroxy-tetrahydrodipicolinate reductase n=1 Tax=Halobacterium sp. KA-4 TaxID=2896367 RepID=UPI001E5747B8|nr:4-hydroxy-tetrahydrodipicolinate reductase [Halobacterium sp. KA-4]MCD2198419.1 4-hydroxy-tetrahydrodipicolinate reductase [Halobacterium sp. KA-4]